MRSISAFADITAVLRAPLSDRVLRRTRYVAGALAAVGAVALFNADAPAAEAATRKATTTTTTPTPARSNVDAAVIYTVKRGDTLSAIAARNGLSVGGIATVNGLKDPNRITEGQQ